MTCRMRKKENYDKVGDNMDDISGNEQQVYVGNLVIASDPVFVDWDVFRIEELAAWAILAWEYTMLPLESICISY